MAIKPSFKKMDVYDGQQVEVQVFPFIMKKDDTKSVRRMKVRGYLDSLPKQSNGNNFDENRLPLDLLVKKLD